MALEDILRMDEPAMEPMKAALEEEAAGLSMEEDAMFAEMAPKGRFSKGALNSLVKAHNKVSGMFGMETYPSFTEDITIFPTQFVRELAMIMAAVEDAISMEVLEPDMMLDLTGVKTDRDVAALAGRLEMIAKSKDFKKFLKEAPEEEMASEAPEAMASEAPGEMSEADMDALMMERM